MRKENWMAVAGVSPEAAREQALCSTHCGPWGALVNSRAHKEGRIMNLLAERLKNVWHDEGISGVVKRGRRRIGREIAARFYWHLTARTATLAQLARTEQTDKAATHGIYPQSYLDIYEQYLQRLRRQPINLLEIGLLKGKSVRLWKRYFPKGQIYGIDIDPACRQYEEARISIEIGSQADVRVLERICERAAAPFDIVVDDGSHVNRHIIASFAYLFPRLRRGGLYIIEDLGCSYGFGSGFDIRNDPGWPGMHYNDPDEDLTNRRSEMDRFFEGLIADLDHLRGDIAAVHFWPGLCIIAKAAGQA
jgi:hypothetical protein